MTNDNDCLPGNETYLSPYREAVSKTRKNGSPAEISEALSELGLALFHVDEFEKGAENLDLAISLAQKSGDRGLEARQIGTKGLALAEAKNFETAAQCFQQVIEIADEIDDEGLRSDALGNFGMVFVETGDMALAFGSLQEALDIAVDLDDKRREMVHVGNMGHAHLLAADIENALMCFNQAQDLAVELDDPQSEAGYLTNIGVLAVRLDDQEKIISIFERVKNLTRQTGDLAGELNALNQLIKAATALDRQEMALVYTEAAQKIAQDHSPADSSYDNALVAQLFNLNKTEEAFDRLQKSIAAAQANSDNLREIELLTNQGSAYFDSNKIQDACRVWECALDLAVSLKESHHQARLLGYLSMIAAESGHIEKSITLSLESLEIADRIEDRRIVGEQQVSLSMAYRDLNNMEKARDLCRQAITSFAEVGLTVFEDKARLLHNELEAAS